MIAVSILIKSDTGQYYGFNPSKVGTGMKKITWGKSVPIDEEEYYYDAENDCLKDADGNVWEEETE